MRRTWAVALILLAASAHRASAGTYSFSFSPAYCDVSQLSPPSATTIASGNSSPNKFAYSFPQSAIATQLFCMVQFPYGVNSPNFDVNLTWQTVATSGNVCWGGSYKVTRPGANWGSNDAAGATVATATTTVTASASTDIPTILTPVTARDALAGTTCTVGNCAGYHGILLLQRLGSGSCGSETASPALLTHVNFVGYTN